MVRSFSAVAAIRASAPSAVKPRVPAVCAGMLCPVASGTRAQNKSAKGRPNRERTCVAPTVPMARVGLACVALQAVCAAAAVRVAAIRRRVILWLFSGAGRWEPPAGIFGNRKIGRGQRRMTFFPPSRFRCWRGYPWLGGTGLETWDAWRWIAGVVEGCNAPPNARACINAVGVSRFRPVLRRYADVSRKVARGRGWVSLDNLLAWTQVAKASMMWLPSW